MLNFSDICTSLTNVQKHSRELSKGFCNGRRDGEKYRYRIWRCKEDGYYMVGDNQVQVEGPLRREQFLGIMTGFVRKGKLISTDNVWYRIVTRLWLVMRPFRRCITVPGAKVKKLCRNMLHK